MISDFMDAVARDLAPGGQLRAALSYGNPVVVQRDNRSGEPRGLAVELVEELGHRLAVNHVLKIFDGAAGEYEAGLAGAWDIAFLSIDPERTKHLDFTDPYVTLESTYIVRDESPVHTVLDIDREGFRIAVGEGGFYDLLLTRTLRRAKLVRAPTPRAAFDLFLSDRLDAAAGLRQPLLALSKANQGLRVIDGRFAAAEQAIALPKGRSAGLRYLNAFVAQMRASGKIDAALRHTCEVTTADVSPGAHSG